MAPSRRRRPRLARLRAAVGALVVAAGAVVVLASPGSAQVDGERIHDYGVDLVVEPSGDLVVRETIDYDFG
ncbi:MAG: DUF2207 domain-containing protein, partial [Actinomycetota bacterium]|nr:DUF2207 domain-containing protein [Actinomycetota bacterium]